MISLIATGSKGSCAPSLPLSPPLQLLLTKRRFKRSACLCKYCGFLNKDCRTSSWNNCQRDLGFEALGKGAVHFLGLVKNSEETKHSWSVAGMDGQQHRLGRVWYCSVHRTLALPGARETHGMCKETSAAVLMPFCSFPQVSSSL